MMRPRGIPCRRKVQEAADALFAKAPPRNVREKTARRCAQAVATAAKLSPQWKIRVRRDQASCRWVADYRRVYRRLGRNSTAGERCIIGVVLSCCRLSTSDRKRVYSEAAAMLGSAARKENDHDT